MRRLTFVGMILVTVAGAVVAVSTVQVPPLKEIMQRKLGHSQKVLEAIVLGNFRELEDQATALGVLSEASEWAVFQTPEYSRHSSNFRRSTDSLVEAGAERNGEAAALAYVELVLECVRCHTYVRDARVASGAAPPDLLQRTEMRPHLTSIVSMPRPVGPARTASVAPHAGHTSK